MKMLKTDRRNLALAAIATAIAVTAIPFRALAHGDGRGISGPDLAGNALPIEVDRQVTSEELDRVRDHCSNELAKSFQEQIYGRNQDPNWELFTQGSDAASLTAGMLLKPSSRLMINYYAFKGDHFPKNEETLDLMPKDSSCLDSLKYCDSLIRLVADIAIGSPYVTYDSFNSDYVYGELGQELSHQTYARNIVIHNAQQQPKRFKNATTGIKTDIVLDQRPYVDCVVDGIQSGKFAK